MHNAECMMHTDETIGQPGRIDPVYSETDYCPAPVPAGRWLYPRGEYEAFALARMRRAVKRLKLLVGYPGVFRPPVPTAWFRRGDKAPYAASGFAVEELRPDGFVVRVTVPDISAAAPALSSDATGWEASTDGLHFSAAEPGGSPSGDELPRVALPLSPVAGHPGLFDVGREVVADLSFQCAVKPVFTVGESMREALFVTAKTQEQSFETLESAHGRWDTPLPLAFRYVLVKDGTPPPSVKAAFTPLVYRCTYDFGDVELNRIWEAAAYTLRLCIQTFQIDGVKRDRLPWGGDLAISLLANAYSFREPDPIRRTLTVLFRDGVQYSQVNGIIDYSLWCVISHGLYKDHFGDLPFLRASWPVICQTLDWFLARARGDGGLLRPSPPDVDARNEMWFIDWADIDKTTALQMLLHWALVTGSRLADAMCDAPSRERYAAEAATLRERIDAAAFDDASGLYRGDTFNPASPPQRHANFLAVLSGVAGKGACARIAEGLISSAMPEAGTPYMISLEILALHELGRDAEALAKLRRVWGGMLRLGATTFFEGYRDDFDEETMCVFYDRPFGMSLCHAWSAAPCALLPILTGRTIPDNCQMLCRDCNRKMG